MERRVIEHQARGVVLVERRADAELGAELGFLVGAHHRIAVADRNVGIARQEHAAVGQALERREAAQRVIVGKGVVEEGAFEARQIEAPGEGFRFVRRQLDQTGAQSCASESANTVRPAALSGPSWANAGGRMTSA
jgi:hypothetical protein